MLFRVQIKNNTQFGEKYVSTNNTYNQNIHGNFVNSLDVHDSLLLQHVRTQLVDMDKRRQRHGQQILHPL